METISTPSTLAQGLSSLVDAGFFNPYDDFTLREISSVDSEAFLLNLDRSLRLDVTATFDFGSESRELCFSLWLDESKPATVEAYEFSGSDLDFVTVFDGSIAELIMANFELFWDH